MSALPTPVPGIASGALCSVHADRAATATCGRCGSFVCADDTRSVNGGMYCPACAARPEVDYLEAFRLKYWGRRDAWAWVMGASALLNLLAALGADPGDTPTSVVAARWAVAAFCTCYFLGMRWTRAALLVAPLVSGFAITLQMQGSGESIAFAVGNGIGRALVPLLISIAIYRNTRNKLFFRVEVPKDELLRAWHLYANNSIARSGFLLSLLGLFVLPVGAIALVLSIIGLRRVDSAAHPPIGRKGQAIAGIALGALSTLALAGLVLFLVVSSRG